MSASPAPVRHRSRLLSATAVAAFAAAAFVPASADAMQLEQISRADGVAGASPIELHSAHGYISDDGASTYVGFVQAWGSWKTATGLWNRDVATNRSTQVVGGTGNSFAGFGADGKVIGVRSSRKLVAADTNSSLDLYTYDVAARRLALVSRRDGANGAAAGATGPSFLTRDGKAALFTTAAGIQRRDLASGRTVTVAAGRLGGYSDINASSDGTVFATEAGMLVTPQGTEQITIPDTYAANATVSPSGRWAIVTAVRASDGADVGFVLDVATGVRTPFDLASLGDRARIVGIGADDRALVARSTSDLSFEVVALTLPTGATSRVATYDAPLTSMHSLSRNGKFAVLTSNGGPSFAASADGVNLPGGADLPSPGIYSVVYEGCRAGGWPWYTPARPSAFSRGASNAPYLPKFASLALRLTYPSGALISNTVIPSMGGGTWPSLPAGGPFRLTATATYPDGRTTTEDWTIPAPSGVCGIGF